MGGIVKGIIGGKGDSYGGSDFSNKTLDQLESEGLLHTDQGTVDVQNDPLLSRLYGSGADSLTSRTLQQQKDLSGRQGFSMQPEDYEAYGQASGNIARQSGQQENQLAQMLASRGLASGTSGAAGQAYTGLAGNKFEQLAQKQMQIAQNRMEMNRQRLNDASNLARSLGQDTGDAIQQAYGRNLARRDDARATAGSRLAQQQAQAADAQSKFASEQASQSGGLLGGISSGILSGVTGGVSGGLSSGIGGLTKGIFSTQNQPGPRDIKGPTSGSQFRPTPSGML